LTNLAITLKIIFVSIYVSEIFRNKEEGSGDGLFNVYGILLDLPVTIYKGIVSNGFPKEQEGYL